MIQIWVKMLQRPIFGSRCNIFFCGSGVAVYNFVAEIRSGGTGFRGLKLGRCPG